MFTGREWRGDEAGGRLPPTFRKGRLLTEKVANLKGPPALLPRPSETMNAEETTNGRDARPIPNRQLCCYEMFTTRLLSAASCAPGGDPPRDHLLLACVINFILPSTRPTARLFYLFHRFPLRSPPIGRRRFPLFDRVSEFRRAPISTRKNRSGESRKMIA